MATSYRADAYLSCVSMLETVDGDVLQKFLPYMKTWVKNRQLERHDSQPDGGGWARVELSESLPFLLVEWQNV